MSSALVKQQTWLIVGASRGIGLEYTRQLLVLNHRVLATARDAACASHLLALANLPIGHNLSILECDIAEESSIYGLRDALKKMGNEGLSKIDVCVLNAGILVYPNRISELSFKDFAAHLHTNTIGPLICASALLSLTKPIETWQGMKIETLVFTSSDSGSTTNFRAFEDGFGAYAASKAALNQGLRHLAAELKRAYVAAGKIEETPVVLAIHPGEVSTDMASNVRVDWVVEGVIEPEESIEKMLNVIALKGFSGTEMEQDRGVATFWDWEGRAYPW